MKQPKMTARAILLRERRAFHEASIDWYGNMLVCVDQMLTPEERAEFDEWDLNRPDGVPTSDWPGFVKHIGPPPYKGRRARPKLVSISAARATAPRTEAGPK
jgi:hypothetical protein